MSVHEKETGGEINPLPEESLPRPASRGSIGYWATDDHQFAYRPHAPTFRLSALGVGCYAAMHDAALTE